ncbi:hypothetical protein Hypma_008476 [Hypsizygus marmoreus]|uniref:F-box domain-containing protein n=1 Tax=Hypsizygus marmoreus TaxID=39966 RepID=A0A369JXR2_HYPMA|nr:hypothetical protein Hypma_008476 [Hypsizygus marmoreus]
MASSYNARFLSPINDDGDTHISACLDLNAGTSIDFLPVEILLKILQIVRDMSYDSHNHTTAQGLALYREQFDSPRGCASLSNGARWCEDEDLASPFLFPYAQAAVCSYWQEAMSQVPNFWTRIVVIMDDTRSSLSDISEQLTWSRDLLFEINVISPHDSCGSDEAGRVSAIIALLRPHTARCLALRFDVTHSSSLPSISADLDVRFDNLVALNLKARSPGNPRDYPLSVEHRIFTLPTVLQSLHLDGKNFVDLCISDPAWAVKFGESGRRVSLAISDLLSEDWLGKFSGIDFLRVIANIKWMTALKLTRVHFIMNQTWLETNRHAMALDVIQISALDLEDVSADVIFGLLMGCDFDWLRVANSELSYPPEADNLILDGVSASLDTYLQNWGGTFLFLKNCSGFEDNFLSRLQRINPFDFAQSSIYLPGLAEMHIVDCGDFSSTAVEEMMEGRRRQGVNGPAVYIDGCKQE